jgi:hypothetical protein
MSLGGETRRWAAEASGYVLSSTHQPVQPEDQFDPEVGRKYYYMKTYVGALETIYELTTDAKCLSKANNAQHELSHFSFCNKEW